MIDRINSYMVYYTNQEINLIWLFAQEIWKYDTEFLNPFLEKDSVSVKALFTRWLEIALVKFHMFPKDQMKLDELTQKTLLNTFKRIFENIVYPIQEANQSNYSNLSLSEVYYTKLKTIDRLTHMKDELEYEFRLMKTNIENIFLLPRPELIEYGTYFFEVYMEKTQEFFPINDFLNAKKKINLKRFFKVLSYFRMVPDDITNESVWIKDYPMKVEVLVEIIEEQPDKKKDDKTETETTPPNLNDPTSNSQTATESDPKVEKDEEDLESKIIFSEDEFTEEQIDQVRVKFNKSLFKLITADRRHDELYFQLV
jgi:hypothetical protein